MRKITRPGQAAIAAASKDDAIDVEGRDRRRGRRPSRAERPGDCGSCSSSPAAGDRGGGDATAPSPAATAPRSRARREARRRPSRPREAAPRQGASSRRPRSRATSGSGTPSGGTRRKNNKKRKRRCRRSRRTESDRESRARCRRAESRRERSTMEWVETTGRTIAEALDAALDELGCRRGRRRVRGARAAEERIPRRGSASSEGRIRARVKPISREKPGERQRRKGRRFRPAAVVVGDGRTWRRTAAGATRPRRRAAGDAAPPKAGAQRRRTAVRRTGAARRSGRRRRPGRRGQRHPRNDETDRGIRPDPASTRRRAAGEHRGHDRARRTDRGAGRGGRGVHAGSGRHLPARRPGQERDRRRRGRRRGHGGEPRASSSGPKGATLHAIEELVRTVVQRQTDGHGVRIHVDVAGYRAKRREALADVHPGARREGARDRPPAGARADVGAATARSSTTPPSEIDGIATASEGEDPRRRVVLRPA